MYNKKIGMSFLYILPLISGLIIFKFYPMIQILLTSFKEEFSYLTSEYKSFGMENFRYVIQDEYFIQGLLNGVVYTFLASTLCFFISFPIAWCLYRINSNVSKWFQVIICLPFVTSDIAMGSVWRLLFSDGGWINSFLNILGISSVGWLTTSNWSFVLLTAIGIWNALPFSVLVIYCSLLNIDSNLILMAEINGAGEGKILKQIVAPMIKSSLITLFILNLTKFWLEINVLFSLFMGQPGPFNNLYLPVYYIYEKMHQGRSFAYACAGAVILFACIVLTMVAPATIKRMVRR